MHARFPILSIWRHRDLLVQFTRRGISQRHRATLFGGAWAVLTPLLMMGLYATVLGAIFGGRYGVRAEETGLDYALGIFLSLTVFQLLGETLAQSPSIVVSQANLVKKVIFPLELLPVSTFGTTFFYFLINLCLALLAVAFVGPGLQPTAVLLPIVLLPLFMICLGVAWWLSALGVFLRDIAQATGFVSQALLYASAVFYSTERIPEAIWTWVRFNPLTHLVSGSRDILLWSRPPDWWGVGYAYVCGVMLLVSGLLVFAKCKRAFADVL